MKKSFLAILLFSIFVRTSIWSLDLKEIQSIKLTGVYAGAMYALDNDSIIVWDNTGSNSGSFILNIRNGQFTNIPEYKWVETTDRKFSFLLYPADPFDSYDFRLNVVQIGKAKGYSDIIRMVDITGDKYSFIRYTLPEMKESIIDDSILYDKKNSIYIHYPTITPYGYIFGNSAMFCTIGNGMSEIFVFTIDEHDKMVGVKKIESSIPYLKPITETIFVGAEFQKYSHEGDENSYGEWLLIVAEPEKDISRTTSIRVIGREHENIDSVFITMPDGKTVVYVKNIIPYKDGKVINEIELGVAELVY